jgi:hypothetical protein
MSRRMRASIFLARCGCSQRQPLLGADAFLAGARKDRLDSRLCDLASASRGRSPPAPAHRRAAACVPLRPVAISRTARDASSMSSGAPQRRRVLPRPFPPALGQHLDVPGGIAPHALPSSRSRARHPWRALACLALAGSDFGQPARRADQRGALGRGERARWSVLRPSLEREDPLQRMRASPASTRRRLLDIRLDLGDTLGKCGARRGLCASTACARFTLGLAPAPRAAWRSRGNWRAGSGFVVPAGGPGGIGLSSASRTPSTRQRRKPRLAPPRCILLEFGKAVLLGKRCAAAGRRIGRRRVAVPAPQGAVAASPAAARSQARPAGLAPLDALNHADLRKTTGAAPAVP